MMDLTDVNITKKDINDYFDKLENRIKESKKTNMDDKVIYTFPILLTEHNDESGHYFVVTSPDIQGLVTDGKTIKQAKGHAKDAIQGLLETMDEYPHIADDPFMEWDELKDDQAISEVNVSLEEKPWEDDGGGI